MFVLRPVVPTLEVVVRRDPTWIQFIKGQIHGVKWVDTLLSCRKEGPFSYSKPHSGPVLLVAKGNDRDTGTPCLGDSRGKRRQKGWLYIRDTCRNWHRRTSFRHRSHTVRRICISHLFSSFSLRHSCDCRWRVETTFRVYFEAVMEELLQVRGRLGDLRLLSPVLTTLFPCSVSSEWDRKEDRRHSLTDYL